ncbi:MAG: hypothetical protein EAX95_10955 [Candidatus Thorarchaeota archaeon]|nr:hypothetical protein [Candidatus Thorarchaeota archaeon]
MLSVNSDSHQSIPQLIIESRICRICLQNSPVGIFIRTDANYLTIAKNRTVPRTIARFELEIRGFITFFESLD